MILIIFWPWMSLHFPCFIVEYLNPQPQDGWILGKGHIYDRCGHFYFPMDSALTIFHYYLIIGAEYSRYRWACFSVPVPKMRSFSIYKQNATWYNSTRDIMTRLNNLIGRWLHSRTDVAIFFFSIFTNWKYDATIFDEWLRVRGSVSWKWPYSLGWVGHFLFTPFHSHATIKDETLCPVSIF